MAIKQDLSRCCKAKTQVVVSREDLTSSPSRETCHVVIQYRNCLHIDLRGDYQVVKAHENEVKRLEKKENEIDKRVRIGFTCNRAHMGFHLSIVLTTESTPTECLTAQR